MFAHARTGVCLLAAALGALAWSPPATAKCADSTIEVFPETSAALPTNGRIVVEIAGLIGADRTPSAVPMQLRNGTERVLLNVVDTNVEAVGGVVQMVFVPARELRADTTYTLYLSEEARPLTRSSDPIAWTTSAGADRTAPRWRAAPRSGPGVSAPLGCGSEVFVPVSVALDGDDEDAVRILAEVRPIGGAVLPTGGPATARYLLERRGGGIKIGHEMCGGPFDLEPGRRYTVRLTAVDAAGNKAPAPGRPLEILGPVFR
jgi:hypothetical protein